MSEIIKCRVCNELKESSDFYMSKKLCRVSHRICKTCSKKKSKEINFKRKLIRIKNKLINEQEIYKKVALSPVYEISNMGNVWHNTTASKLNGYSSNKGYSVVKLFLANGDKFCTGIHRLVALAFLDNPLNLPEVNHLDGNKKNNKLDNLEWSTTKNNIHHAIRIGLRPADINLSKNELFNNYDLIKIRTLIGKGVSNKEISSIYNCHHSTISKIKRGVNYANR